MKQIAPKRLLSIGHSYVVGVNRRLPEELARAGGGAWDITVVAPIVYKGGTSNLRSHTLNVSAGQNYRLEAVPMHCTNHVHFAFYNYALRKILSEGWDIIHCWEEPYIFAGGQVAMWRPRGSILVFCTFQNLLKRYPLPFNIIERYSLSRAAAWIAFGHTVEETLLNRRPYRERDRRTIPIGVDVEFFRPDLQARKEIHRRLNWDCPGPPVVGYLGRFVEEKGLRLLIRALDAVAAPWRALIIGDGPLENTLRAWASTRQERVRVVTGVSHSEVPRYLNAMDMLCAPSQTTRHWREQFGRMLIEAFSCGVPVIASDSGEMPYVVHNAGIIVPENDESRWIETINALLTDSGRREALSQRGLHRARTVFSWSVIANANLNFFDDLLHKR